MKAVYEQAIQSRSASLRILERSRVIIWLRAEHTPLFQSQVKMRNSKRAKSALWVTRTKNTKRTRTKNTKRSFLAIVWTQWTQLEVGNGCTMCCSEATTSIGTEKIATEVDQSTTYAITCAWCPCRSSHWWEPLYVVLNELSLTRVLSVFKHLHNCFTDEKIWLCSSA